MSELRIELSPVEQPAGGWQVRILDGSPNPPTDVVQTTLTQQDLAKLRRNPWVRDINLLHEVGGRVWSTVMLPPILQLVNARLQAGAAARVRLVFVLSAISLNRAAIGLAEIPFEGLYQQHGGGFLTTQGVTISRSLHMEPDLDPLPISRPLRVLVAAATPADQPQASSAKEVADIKAALQPGIDDGSFVVHLVENATIRSLADAIGAFHPHVLHFIGHAGFEDVEGDGTPEPYLCFEDGTPARNTRRVKKDTFATMFDGDLRLFVLSACSSAAAGNQFAPADPSGPIFDGMAQQLVQDRRVAAAVAMQFDLEPWAAIAFSRGFYTSLLDPLMRLDDAVLEGRKEILQDDQNGDPGERAWLTPVVYTRCKSGRAFNLVPLDSQELKALEITATSTRKQLLDLWAAGGAAAPGPVRDLIRHWVDDLHGMGAERAALVKDSVRIVGDKVAPGAPATVGVHLHTGLQGVVDSLIVTVRHPGMRVTDVQKGAAVVGNVIRQPAPSGTELTLVRPAGAAVWPPGDREVVRLVLEVDPASAAPALIEVVPEEPAIVLGGNEVFVHTVPGWVCLL